MRFFKVVTLAAPWKCAESADLFHSIARAIEVAQLAQVHALQKQRPSHVPLLILCGDFVQDFA